MLALAGVCLWAVSGLPRWNAVLFPNPGGAPDLHAAIALPSLVLAIGALGREARRFLDADARRRSPFALAFASNPTAMIGLFGALVLAALALFTPLLAPFDPNLIDAGPKNTAPCFAYPLGTDTFGRDLLSRLLYGGRISLSIGFVAVSIAATIGTTVGAVAGYVGGWVDAALMWVVNLILALPRLVFLLTIVGLFRTTGAQSLMLIVVILGLTGWPGVSRIVRSQVLSLKEQDFIQAARSLGFSTPRILFVHLVPNVLAPVIVFCSLAVGSTILAEAGLSYLGLGVPPPTSTWGTLVTDGRESLRVAPWVATFPGLAIVWAVMCFNLLGDGLRDTLDPKLRGR